MVAFLQAGVDRLSYLITWPGSQPQLPPALFISHFDVVPVPEDSYKVCKIMNSVGMCINNCRGTSSFGLAGNRSCVLYCSSATLMWCQCQRTATRFVTHGTALEYAYAAAEGYFALGGVTKRTSAMWSSD
jgi:hypothetical protein